MTACSPPAADRASAARHAQLGERDRLHGSDPDLICAGDPLPDNSHTFLRRTQSFHTRSAEPWAKGQTSAKLPDCQCSAASGAMGSHRTVDRVRPPSVGLWLCLPLAGFASLFPCEQSKSGFTFLRISWPAGRLLQTRVKVNSSLSTRIRFRPPPPDL